MQNSYIGCSVQDWSNSIANVLELLQSYAKPSIRALFCYSIILEKFIWHKCHLKHIPRICERKVGHLLLLFVVMVFVIASLPIFVTMASPALGPIILLHQGQWSNGTQIATFIGPTWGPSGADRTQVGPMLAPWTLLSGKLCYTHSTGLNFCKASLETRFQVWTETAMWKINHQSLNISIFHYHKFQHKYTLPNLRHVILS